VNVAVSVADVPVVIVPGEAVKLVTVGAGTTVTVADCVDTPPAALVTVRVYVVVPVGVTVTGVPLTTAILPGEITPVPPVKLAVSEEVDPAVMVDGEAVNAVIDGSA
jgi:hypothetical protein